ncbi:MAG: flagellar biosynthesis protein FlgC [Micavibrio aeruginosavorus]|uniref:Flagellar biosynthesis protein FlgC n=1 Tax=Micavibrio aeruginosavorus TaxID=349221 RepID=A0A2W5PL02_9BACT|nr:MAG: flagellar biosynthesis protein FlgC [Micavibrio aeruginosavorus]
MIGAISTALSGLMAASKRVEASASNIANVSSAGSLDPASPNQPYQAQTTVQTANESGGASATNIPKTPGIVNAYAPDSPFANAQGEVGAPNVDLAEEAVNLKLAEISYKANIATLKTADEMSDSLLNIFDKRV